MAHQAPNEHQGIFNLLIALIPALGAGVGAWFGLRTRKVESSSASQQSKDNLAFSTQAEIIKQLRDENKEIRADLKLFRADYEEELRNCRKESRSYREQRDNERHEKVNAQQRNVAYLETIRLQAVEIVHIRDHYDARIAELEREVVKLGGTINGHTKPVDAGRRPE